MNTRATDLRLPPRAERDLGVTLITAWIAHESDKPHNRAGVELSERTAQVSLGMSSRSTAHKRFRKAQEWDLIRVSDRWGHRRGRQSVSGNRYQLGRNAARYRQRWIFLGHALFGDGGLLHDLMSSGFMLHNAFGRDGRWLTLALLKRRGAAGSTAAELHAEAAGLLRSPELVVKHLDRFVDLGLASVERRRPKVSSRYVFVADDAYMTDLAWTEQWAPRYVDMERRIQDEQLRLTSLTSDVLKLRCVYCGRPPGNDRLSKMTIEHLPPQTWTRSREFGLLLSACVGCNTSLGGRLTHHKEPPNLNLQPRLPALTAEDWDTLSAMSDYEVLKSLEPFYTTSIRDYRDGVLTGDWKTARRAAVNLAPFSEAVRNGALELVNRQTGELRVINVPVRFARRVAYVAQDVVPRGAIIDRGASRPVATTDNETP